MILWHLNFMCRQFESFLFTQPMKMEQTECSKTLAYKNSDARESPQKKDTTMEMNFRPYLTSHRFLQILASHLVANVMFMM